MDNSTITSAWVAGWAVSRSTAAPVERPWGYRIDVGQPGHVLRHVLPEPDGATVRMLCGSETEPGTWLRLLAAPEAVGGWITPGWKVPDDPGFLMFTALRRSPLPEPPAGYAVRTERTDGVVRVRVPTGDGGPAARGQAGLAGETAVVDQVETDAGHRRKGLGRLVMRTLETAAADAGATTGILAGTTDGRALYSALGWRLHGPITGVVRVG
ncbi:GNAT family N-acetyltransferase [Streptomyces sp. NBC_00370]|uniref:GNAT family N-acetyltransferase n=1 Tax=Streptomyces sp. NBC_00370 TaxID=2975728 RepID=UPI002E2715A9